MKNTTIEVKFSAKIVNDEGLYSADHLMMAFMKVIAQVSADQVAINEQQDHYRYSLAYRMNDIINECADNGLFRIDGTVYTDEGPLIYEPLQSIGVSIEGDIHNCYLDTPVYENTYRVRSLDELQDVLDDDIANSTHYEMGIELDMSEIYEFDVTDFQQQFKRFNVISPKEERELRKQWTCDPTYSFDERHKKGEGSFVAAGTDLIKP